MDVVNDDTSFDDNLYSQVVISEIRHNSTSNEPKISRDSINSDTVEVTSPPPPPPPKAFENEDMFFKDTPPSKNGIIRPPIHPKPYRSVKSSGNLVTKVNTKFSVDQLDFHPLTPPTSLKPKRNIFDNLTSTNNNNVNNNNNQNNNNNNNNSTDDHQFSSTISYSSKRQYCSLEFLNSDDTDVQLDDSNNMDTTTLQRNNSAPRAKMNFPFMKPVKIMSPDLPRKSKKQPKSILPITKTNSLREDISTNIKTTKNQKDKICKVDKKDSFSSGGFISRLRPTKKTKDKTQTSEQFKQAISTPKNPQHMTSQVPNSQLQQTNLNNSEDIQSDNITQNSRYCTLPSHHSGDLTSLPKKSKYPPKRPKFPATINSLTSSDESPTKEATDPSSGLSRPTRMPPPPPANSLVVDISSTEKLASEVPSIGEYTVLNIGENSPTNDSLSSASPLSSLSSEFTNNRGYETVRGCKPPPDKDMPRKPVANKPPPPPKPPSILANSNKPLSPITNEAKLQNSSNNNNASNNNNNLNRRPMLPTPLNNPINKLKNNGRLNEEMEIKSINNSNTIPKSPVLPFRVSKTSKSGKTPPQQATTSTTDNSSLTTTTATVTTSITTITTSPIPNNNIIPLPITTSSTTANNNNNNNNNNNSNSNSNNTNINNSTNTTATTTSKTTNNNTNNSSSSSCSSNIVSPITTDNNTIDSGTDSIYEDLTVEPCISEYTTLDISSAVLPSDSSIDEDPLISMKEGARRSKYQTKDISHDDNFAPAKPPRSIIVHNKITLAQDDNDKDIIADMLNYEVCPTIKNSNIHNNNNNNNDNNNNNNNNNININNNINNNTNNNANNANNNNDNINTNNEYGTLDDLDLPVTNSHTTVSKTSTLPNVYRIPTKPPAYTPNPAFHRNRSNTDSQGDKLRLNSTKNTTQANQTSNGIRNANFRNRNSFSQKFCNNFKTQSQLDKAPLLGLNLKLIDKCIEYLSNDNYLKEEGLFRIPGNKTEIDKYADMFSKDIPINFNEEADPHTISCLLKSHIRINGGILSKQQSSDLFTAVRQKNMDDSAFIINNSSKLNLEITRKVLFLLSEVCSNSEVNLMTPGNLATSCGPSLFPSINSGNAALLTKILIDMIDTIFPDY